MRKKIPYKAGDHLSIRLTDGRTAICKLILAPKGKLKQHICCTVIGIKQSFDLEALELQKFIGIHPSLTNKKAFLRAINL